MKTILFLSVLLMTSRTPGDFILKNPDCAGVNTHIYEFVQEDDTPAPKGYKPVYISHYGRHGARTGMKVGTAYDDVINVLRSASDRHLLTERGDSLLMEAMLVDKCHDGMEGRLTRRGEFEHRELARRLYARYRPVFRDGPGYVRVESSTVPRCLASMAAFTTTLSSLQPDIEYTFDTGEKFFQYINNVSSPEVRKIVSERIDSLNATVVTDNDSFFRDIFKDPAKGREMVGDEDVFLYNVWTVAREASASGLTTDVFRFLPYDVVRKWRNAELLKVYMNHCNSIEFGEERMERAKPLVSVMIRQADEALAGGKVAADLKFGHDYPLLATASYFALEGVGDRLSFEDVPLKWTDPMNIPFASNLQMVFYRNKAGDVIVKFVYNGRERSVRGLEPLKDRKGNPIPYYKWKDVRSRFIPQEDVLPLVWTEIERGAQYAVFQGNLFGRPQTVSIVRYPVSALSTDIMNDSGLNPPLKEGLPSAADPDCPAVVTSSFANRYDAVAAINGSYFNVKTLYPTTYVRQGKSVEGHTTPEELVRVDGFVASGSGKVGVELSDTLSYGKLSKGWKDVLAAGPVLMKDGKKLSGWPLKSFFTGTHPRSAIGISPDGRVYMIVIDGRFPDKAVGMTIEQTAELCRMLGLKDAINLDGGGSSTLWVRGQGVISHPYDNRKYDHEGERIVPNVIIAR